MSFEQNFNNLKEIFMKSDVIGYNGKLAYQFNITGDGDGTFYTEIKDGKLIIEPFGYDDRDAGFTASYDTFLSIAKGEADPIKLFLTGKLKVDGSIEKALEIKKFITH